MLGAGKPMVLLGRGGCPPVLDVPQSPGVYDSERRRAVCNATWTEFVEYVRKTRPEVVVLVGHGARFFSQGERKTAARARADASFATSRQDAHAFEVGLTGLVTSLQQTSRVIYLLEIPTFDSSPTCLLRPVRLPGSTCSPQVPRDALAQRRSQYTQSVFKVQHEHPGLMVVDSLPSLCGAKNCSQVERGGRILYSDKLHLSPAGGRRLAQGSGLSKVITDETGASHE